MQSAATIFSAGRDNNLTVRDFYDVTTSFELEHGFTLAKKYKGRPLNINI